MNKDVILIIVEPLTANDLLVGNGKFHFLSVLNLQCGDPCTRKQSYIKSRKIANFQKMADRLISNNFSNFLYRSNKQNKKN